MPMPLAGKIGLTSLAHTEKEAARRTKPEERSILI